MTHEPPHVDQISLHYVTAEDVSVDTSIHDWFGVVVIRVGTVEIKLFTELDQIAAIRRNLGK
jgi:hypothetical protein